MTTSTVRLIDVTSDLSAAPFSADDDLQFAGMGRGAEPTVSARTPAVLRNEVKSMATFGQPASRGRSTFRPGQALAGVQPLPATTTPASGRLQRRSRPVSVSNRYVTTADGVRLHVLDYKPSTPKHTVVLLHGLCLDKDTWAIQIRQLIRRWGDTVRIIAYDHRGQGESDAAPMHTYRIDQLAEDLAQLLTALRVRGPVTLAGHSMGGMAALAYLARPAAARPVDPHAVILVATAAGKLTERGLGRLLATPATSLLYTLVERAPHAAADAAVRVLAGPLCRALTRFGYGDSGTRHDALVALSAASINATELAAKAGFLRSLQTYDQYQTLGSITAETTILSGGTDKLTPPEHARDLAAGIPNATVVYHPDAGHMLPHETPRLVTDAISGAITRSRAAAAV
jgi:pimeloyl-ACP methyl ester carboxylesterase